MRCRKERSLLVRLPVGLCDEVSRSYLRRFEYHTMMRANRGSGAAYKRTRSCDKRKVVS